MVALGANPHPLLVHISLIIYKEPAVLAASVKNMLSNLFLGFSVAKTFYSSIAHLRITPQDRHVFCYGSSKWAGREICWRKLTIYI